MAIRAGLALLAVLALAPGAAAAGLRLTNASDWEIHHLFLSPAGKKHWGPDQLGRQVLAAHDGVAELHDVPCATYDVKFIDEDANDCLIPEVDVCAAGGWSITNDDLLDCMAEPGD